MDSDAIAASESDSTVVSYLSSDASQEFRCRRRSSGCYYTVRVIQEFNGTKKSGTWPDWCYWLVVALCKEDKQLFQ